MRKGENIYKRKDGRWEARYHSGYTETGKPKMKSVYGTTYTEAKAKRNQAIQTQTQPIKGHILTFDELFSSYIKHVQFSVKATTIATYTEWYQKHLSPFFGCNKIDSITTDKVNYFIQQKINTISVNHTLNIMVLFKTLINYAKEAGFMHSNQLNNIVKLTRYETTIRIFTDEEQQKIEHYLTTHLNTLNAGFLLCFYIWITYRRIMCFNICGY